MFSTLKAGGILMFPIILCGVIAIFIIVERLIYFHAIKEKDLSLAGDLDAPLRSGNYDACMSICNEAKTPMADVIKRAIECRRYQEEDLREVVEAEMDYVVPKYEHLLTALGTIASIATLLGLLGTVTGNIKAFGVLGAGGTMGDPSMLAGSIGEALVTTVAGLIVSIPALIFHNYFKNQVNHKIVEMEKVVTEIVLRLTGRI